jgi:hypothetical protein
MGVEVPAGLRVSRRRVAALLYFNGGFAWTAAMSVGAAVTGLLSLLWIVWVGHVEADFEEGPILLMWLMSACAHIGVLIWGWVAHGAATAVPWLFIGLGVLGLVSSVMQARNVAEVTLGRQPRDRTVRDANADLDRTASGRAPRPCPLREPDRCRFSGVHADPAG